MKRDIFYQEEPAQQKRLTKAADFNKSEIKNVICHDTPEVSVANDPTKNRIKKEDLLQKKTLRFWSIFASSVKKIGKCKRDSPGNGMSEGYR